MPSIKSIKKPNSESIRISSNSEGKDLKKLKHDGYQVFEKEIFLIKCTYTYLWLIKL